MTESVSTRLGVRLWSADTDTPGREEFSSSHARLEERALRRAKGSRPEAALEWRGAIHYSSTTSANGVLSICNGQEWVDANIASASAASDIGELDGTADPGSTGLLAPYNHRHGYATGAIPLSALVTGTAGRVIGFSSYVRQLTRLPKITLASLDDNTPNRVLGFNDSGNVALVSPSVEEDSVALSDFADGAANKILGFTADGVPAAIDNVPSRSVGLQELATGTANTVIGYNASRNPEYKSGVSPSSRTAQLSHLAAGTPNKFLGYDSSGNVVETDVTFGNGALALSKLVSGSANKVFRYGSDRTVEAGDIEYADGSVTLAKLANTNTSSRPQILAFDSDGNPTVYWPLRSDTVDLDAVKAISDTNKVWGFNSTGVPSLLDLVPDRSVGTSQLATGTQGKYLGYDGDGNPAEVGLLDDGSVTLDALTHAGSAGYDKVLGYTSSGPSYLTRTPDDSVGLNKIAHGTGNTVLGFDSTGIPTEVARRTHNRHVVSMVNAAPTTFAASSGRASYSVSFPDTVDLDKKLLMFYFKEVKAFRTTFQTFPTFSSTTTETNFSITRNTIHGIVTTGSTSSTVLPLHLQSIGDVSVLSEFAAHSDLGSNGIFVTFFVGRNQTSASATFDVVAYD